MPRKYARRNQPKPNYYEYIQSEAWQAKRRKLFTQKLGQQCFICCASRVAGFHAHHRTYKRLGNERVGLDLVVVCPGCHTKIHDIQKERGIHIWDATKRAKRPYWRKIRKEKEANRIRTNEKADKTRAEKKAKAALRELNAKHQHTTNKFTDDAGELPAGASFMMALPE